MLRVLVALLVSVAAATTIIKEDSESFTKYSEIISIVNNDKTSTWRASVPQRFANATVADVKKLLGTIMPGESGYMEPEVERMEFLWDSDIPTSFDVRSNWPECSGISGHVRDQSSCGSCWAFGSTEAFNDRYCIKTGDAKTLFSPEDTVSCCSGIKCSMSMGCNGGQPSGAWNWFTHTGVVSGGDYDDVGQGSTCQPYTLQPCAHHVAPTEGQVACDSLPEYSTPKCASSCQSGYGASFKNDKHFASSSYSVKGTENMQRELMEKGTLSVAFTVYEDFETYSGGVYQHKTGKALGGHAIKMIGWGEENGTPYWICVNSWGPTWGDVNDGGTFKILRGSNECGIEGSVVAGDA